MIQRPAFPFILFFAVWLTSNRPVLGEELVYENTTTFLGMYRASAMEFGDQIDLGGSARTVTDFAFEYYGDFTQYEGDESARIRFYANDGPFYSDFSDSRQPGTLLYDSGLFPVNLGYNSKGFIGMTVNVPDSFTWTIQFYGLRGVPGDQGGLLYYSPPTVGASYDDFWIKTETGWTLFGDPTLKDNFSAEVLASEATVHKPAVISTEQAGSDIIVTANTSVGKVYALEYTNSTTGAWIETGRPQRAEGALTTFVDPGAGAGAARSYRVRILDIAPSIQSISLQNGAATVVAKVEAGRSYQLEYKLSPADTDWIRIINPGPATGPTATFVDANAVRSPSRIYRVVLLL